MNRDITEQEDESLLKRRTDRIVAIRNFAIESEAILYAARLQASGIPAFISNANTTTVIPLGGASISLHVRSSHVIDAMAIIRDMEERTLRAHPEDVSYHEATMEDILYMKEIHEQEQARHQKGIRPLAIGVTILTLLIVLRAFLRATGYLETWRDFF